MDLPKNSIIFNHKQTEGLLKNGHIASRGKAYASGNAHVTLWSNGSSTSQWESTGWDGPTDESYDLANALNDAADAAENLEDTLDWIAIRMEEYEETFSRLNAKIENAIGSQAKNTLIQSLIVEKGKQQKDYASAETIYKDKANEYLNKITDPTLREFAENGALAISALPDDISEDAKNLVEKYREFAALSAEAATKQEEIKSEISDLAKQKFDNIADQYNNVLDSVSSGIERLETQADLYDQNASGYYGEMIRITKNTKLPQLTNKRNALNESLQDSIKKGHIVVGDANYNQMMSDIAALDNEILQCSADLEDLAQEKLDSVSKKFENQIGNLRDANDLIEAGIENMEQKGFANVNAEYEKMIDNVDTVRSKLEEQAGAMQKTLDEQVREGNIKEGSDEWYEMVAAISDVRAEVESCTTEIEELATKKLDAIVSEFESVSKAIDGSNDILKAQIDLMENLGYEVIGEKFNEMLGNTGDKLNTLQNEYVNLYQAFQDEVSAGRIAKGSEAYNEWQEKLKALKVEIAECNAELEDLARQKFDSITNQFDNQIGLTQNLNEALQDQIDLQEESGNIASPKYYEEMIGNTKDMQSALIEERDALQAVLDEQVKAGNIKVGSDIWYEMVEAINDVNSEITQSVADLEQFQNAINDIHWDNFDEFIKRIDYVNNETQNIVDLLSEADMVVTPETEDGWNASDVKWTDEGITTLAMYAQQMEIAEQKSKEYAVAIDELTKQYKDGRYSESEYLEKLNELKVAQYESIEAYQSAKKAISDLNKARVDEIKNGINKQVEAYEKLISKKKELLDNEKDAYDFQKNITQQQKDISAIQRQIDALAFDNSASARAKRAELQAQLAEAQVALEETYYDRSVQDQQKALDKELEDFKEQKDAELEKWDEYLEDVEAIVAESLSNIKLNTTEVYNTLIESADKYGVALDDDITTPWKNGQDAIDAYSASFGATTSKTLDQIESIKDAWQDVIDKIDDAAEAFGNQKSLYEQIQNGGTNTSSTGTHLNTYASGTTGVKRNQLAIIDEMGLEELVMHAGPNGRLTFLTKGSSVIPADLTSNLMSWGELDPTDMLDRNRPVIQPHQNIVNTEINLDCSVGTMINIENCDTNTLPDVEKIIHKTLENYMKNVNNSIRRFTR